MKIATVVCDAFNCHLLAMLSVRLMWLHCANVVLKPASGKWIEPPHWWFKRKIVERLYFYPGIHPTANLWNLSRISPASHLLGVDFRFDDSNSGNSSTCRNVSSFHRSIRRKSLETRNYGYKRDSLQKYPRKSAKQLVDSESLRFQLLKIAFESEKL